MAAIINNQSPSTQIAQPDQEEPREKIKQPFHLAHPKLHAMWHGFIVSVYITNIWEWFLSLATRAVQPVLFGTVMYNIAMTYPGMTSPGLGWDVAAFLIQNGALDIASFGLPGLARQARIEGNETGAAEAEVLGNHLFKIMVANLVWGGVEHILTTIKNAQFSTFLTNVALVIGLIFVIVRSYYAIRYSVVIHGLKASAKHETPHQEEKKDEQATQQGTQIAELKAQVHTIAESLHKLVEATQKPVNQVHNSVDMEQFERLASIVYSMQTSVTEVNQNVLSITQNLYTTQATQQGTQGYTTTVDQDIQATHPATHLDGVDTLKALGMPILDVPGVSAAKVAQVVAAYLSGTAWREMPGNYSKTIKPIRDAYTPYVDQGTQQGIQVHNGV